MTSATALCFVFAASLAATGCGAVASGSSGGSADSSSEPGGDTHGSEGEGACDSSTMFPWLAEGNFWQVAWSELDAEISAISGGSGHYDAGSYSMVLGAPEVVDGMEMFPITVSGDEKYTPRWATIGTDGCGNLWGQRVPGAPPAMVFAADGWSGAGFYTDYEGFDTSLITSVSGASMVPSRYTGRGTEFGPLIAVGYSHSEKGPAGSGCTYHAGYGTICGSDDPDDYSDETAFEYWDADAGPVGMHLSRNYVEGGSLSDERHSERRVEVWFFGETSKNLYKFETEPDSCVSPTPIPLDLDQPIFSVFGEIHTYDEPAGNVPGCDQPLSQELYDAMADWYPFGRHDGVQVARDVHDWYRFEIVDPERRVEFILLWNQEDIELEFTWHAAPDNEVYGEYVYFGEDYLDETDENIGDFAHQKGIPNPATPGTYLLGIRRTTPSQLATQYGIMVMME